MYLTKLVCKGKNAFAYKLSFRSYHVWRALNDVLFRCI